MTTNLWAKPKIDLKPAGHTTRSWFVCLDDEPGNFTVADVFCPHTWRYVRSRQAHDRAPHLLQLGEGDVVRIVAGDDDFDVVVRGVMPGAVITTLRGARTPWDELHAAEAAATDARRAAVAAKAEAVIAGEAS